MGQAMGGKPFTGKHMLLVLVAFFGTIIGVNLLMAYYATSTWSGLVVGNSYVASQNFNEKQAEAKAMIALGWKADLTYEQGKLTFMLNDEQGQPVKADPVIARMLRPAEAGHDHEVTMVVTSEGVFSAPITLKPGQWLIEMEAGAGLDKPYRFEKRIIVR